MRAPLKTAVLFLVFNRPDTTVKIFEKIRQVKPPRLYIACDGPRENHKNDKEKITKIHNIFINIDWACEVKTLFREKNLGLKKGVSSAITWFFDHEEQGIILEDDCLPSSSFFWFCEELLNLYKKDQKIFMITGFNKQNKWQVNNQDYFFSFFGGCWGWASWRRAWKHYNPDLDHLDYMVKKDLFVSQMGKKIGNLRQKMFLQVRDNIISGKLDTWAYPWALTRHKFGGISCVPCKNLIQNIGFNEDATHTKNLNTKQIEKYEIEFPLKINTNLICDHDYDLLFLENSLIERISRLFNKIFRVF